MILVTGCAGFIGSHLCQALLRQGRKVVGIDNFSPNYDRKLKEENLELLWQHDNFEFLELCLSNCTQLATKNIDLVIHLAATPGVVPSLTNIQHYIDNNISRYNLLLDFMEEQGIRKVIFASSSSVYGNQSLKTYSETLIPAPISPYGFTKQVGEQLNHQYHLVHGFSIINLRLFSVYGNRMRPDLALPKFVDGLLQKQAINLYNNGNDYRDFTHIKDIVIAFLKAIDYIENANSCYETINIGRGIPVKILDVVSCLERITGKKIKRNYTLKRQGEPLYTCSNIERAKELLDYSPTILLEEGLLSYWNWRVADKINV